MLFRQEQYHLLQEEGVKLERQIEFPVSIIGSDYFSGIPKHNFDVIILPSGNHSYINNELRENTGVKFSSVYPNQKNYQYPIRIAAPFLDALSDYSATRYTFEIYKSVDPIKKFTSDQLEWFELKIKDLKGDDITHALLATDFQRVSGFFAGVDPSDGLIKMLYIMHKDSNNHPNAIIRISNIETQ